MEHLILVVETLREFGPPMQEDWKMEQPIISLPLTLDRQLKCNQVHELYTHFAVVVIVESSWYIFDVFKCI